MNCDITSDLPKSADPNGVTRRGSCSLLCPLLFPPPGALKTLNPSPPPLPPPPTKCGLPRKHPKRPLVVLRPALDGYGSTTEHSAAVRARLQPTSVLARGAPNLKKLQHIQLFICFAMSARWARGPIYVKMKGPRLLWERLGGFWDDLGAIWAVLGSVLDQHCHHF